MHLGRSVLLWLIASGTAVAQELKPEEIYRRLLPSIVTLQVEDRAGARFVGTGFLALTNGVAVTAWHVVAGARKVTARFADNEFVDVLGVVDKDEKSDLALIRLPVSSRPQVQLRASQAPIGSRTYVIGAPKGYEFSIADGLVSQMQNVEGAKQYQVSCPVSGGNSGGPLVNSSGEVIGVTSWSKTDAQNISFAIPASCLLSLNPALAPRPWSGLGQPSPARARATEGARPARSLNTGDFERDFWSFKQALKGAAGEEVTVVLVKQARAESFTFVLPAGALDERPLNLERAVQPAKHAKRR